MKRKTIISRRERKKSNFDSKGSNYLRKLNLRKKGKLSKKSPFKVKPE